MKMYLLVPERHGVFPGFRKLAKINGGVHVKVRVEKVWTWSKPWQKPQTEPARNGAESRRLAEILGGNNFKTL